MISGSSFSFKNACDLRGETSGACHLTERSTVQRGGPPAPPPQPEPDPSAAELVLLPGQGSFLCEQMVAGPASHDAGVEMKGLDGG